jgi:site-specific recombinase XerD
VTRGRKRKPNATIPAHINQAALPRGVYWDARDRVWYTIFRDGKARRQRIAGAEAMLSDLHRIMEERAGIDSASLGHLCDLFHASKRFEQLQQSTRAGYEKQRRIVRARRTRAGLLADLTATRISRAFMQRLVEQIESEGTPTKANHLLRYLRRVYTWGINRAHCGLAKGGDNPCAGVEQAKERKQHRMPTPAAHAAILAFARERGAGPMHRKGSVAPYLAPIMEIAYLCRLRGIEVVTLTDDNATEAGLRTNRRKGSNDNVVAWTPRLRAAWDEAIARRGRIFDERKLPVPMRAQDRAVFVNQSGAPLRKGTFDSAWQSMMTLALSEGVIAAADRFSPHGFKHRGVTDTAGNRGDKQTASGHKSPAMLDVYDHDLPVVRPSKEG